MNRNKDKIERSGRRKKDRRFIECAEVKEKDEWKKVVYLLKPRVRGV